MRDVSKIRRSDDSIESIMKSIRRDWVEYPVTVFSTRDCDEGQPEPDRVIVLNRPVASGQTENRQQARLRTCFASSGFFYALKR